MLASHRALARLVAEIEGRVVGIARVRRNADLTMVSLQVDPHHRDAGVGTALLTAVLDRMPGSDLSSIVNDDEGSIAAARAWGFELGRELTMSVVDPRTIRTPSEPTIALSELDPTSVWEAYASAAADDPSGLSEAGELEAFLAEEWRHPDHRPDLGRAVVDQGRVLAFAAVLVAGDRAWNDFTGTRPEARGRGLARRVKTASLAALADAGVTTCGTGNAAANAPMLAVNRALGYRPSGTTYAAHRPSH